MPTATNFANVSSSFAVDYYDDPTLLQVIAGMKVSHGGPAFSHLARAGLGYPENRGGSGVDLPNRESLYFIGDMVWREMAESEGGEVQLCDGFDTLVRYRAR